MRDSLVLKRDLKIECWVVKGSLAFEEPRTELLPLLLAIQESGYIDAESVAKDLLFAETARLRVAQRWLKIAERYGLIRQVKDSSKAKFELTDLGYKALEKGTVFVPQESVWKIWYSLDPLLPSPILWIEAFKEDRKKSGRKDRKFKTIPSFLSGISKRKEILEDLSHSKEVRFETIEQKGELQRGNSRIELIWNVQKNQLKIKGQLSNAGINLNVSAPEYDENELWLQLLESYTITDQELNLFELWDQVNETLKVPFSFTEADERIAMKRSLSFSKYKTQQFGQFNSFSVNNIPTKALTESDAVEWAKWRLGKSINTFATQNNYELWMGKALVPFGEFEIYLPSRRDLANEHWQSHQQKQEASNWYTVASEDWGI